MARILILVFLCAFCTPTVKAIGMVTGGTNLNNYTYSYTTSTPAPPGWNNVGQIGTASATYLGNGWVLTAGHVGPGSFTLNGSVYGAVAGSAVPISNSAGTADLSLFRVSPQPNVASLTLRTTAPIPMTTTKLGCSVVMIGYGGGTTRSWGMNYVTFINEPVTIDGLPYSSNDFFTVTQSFTEGLVTSNNLAQVISGDSGGGDFIFNSTSGQWELAGINEVNGTLTQSGTTVTYPVSGMVDLSTYATQINSIVFPAAYDTPAMPLSALLLLGCLLVLSASHSLGRRKETSK